MYPARLACLVVCVFGARLRLSKPLTGCLSPVQLALSVQLPAQRGRGVPRAHCVSCWCTPRAESTGGVFSNRRNSNDEGYNGSGAHPRVCTLLGPPVSLSTTERATANTLSSSSPIKFTARPYGTLSSKNASEGSVTRAWSLPTGRGAGCRALRAPIGGRIVTSLSIVQSVSLPDSRRRSMGTVCTNFLT